MATSINDKTHTLSIRVPRMLHERVQRIAERESETSSTIVRRLLRRGLDREVERPAEGNQ